MNLTYVLDHFKTKNPGWRNVKVVITDKDFNEKNVLSAAFTDAQQLLCQFHVVDFLRKQVRYLTVLNLFDMAPLTIYVYCTGINYMRWKFNGERS